MVCYTILYVFTPLNVKVKNETGYVYSGWADRQSNWLTAEEMIAYADAPANFKILFIGRWGKMYLSGV